MARKSLGTYYAGHFKMPDLRRADLIQMEEVILQTLKPERYHLSCQGFEYDRVEDIPPDLGCLTTLVIQTHSPCVHLKFARSWAELYSEQNDDRTAPAIQQVAAIISGRERRVLWKLAKLSAWLAPMAGFSGLSAVVILVSFGCVAFPALYGGVAFLALAWAWWVVGYRATLFRFCRINLSAR
jgi:hypothetical protein